jgi:hypothetical protein
MTVVVERRDTWGNATTPGRSLQQRREALCKANDVRTRRAVLKKDMKQRRVSARDMLLEPPEFVETMKVVTLLLAVPKAGRVKVDKALRRCGVSPSKTVGGLSERQRAELVRLMAVWP